MNLSQLERIVMVAKSGNITDVAQKLYISQPALSQTISTVEDEIGAPISCRPWLRATRTSCSAS